jgi:Ca2+-transporting ATPase
VVRNGKHKEIYKDEIVVGDIILITSGLEIPVDGLALRANDLIVDESSMTGEAQ